MLPVTKIILPAPQAFIELVRCQCKATCSTNRCSCRNNNLFHTKCENDEDCNTKIADSYDEDVGLQANEVVGL